MSKQDINTTATKQIFLLFFHGVLLFYGDKEQQNVERKERKKEQSKKGNKNKKRKHVTKRKQLSPLRDQG